jgi:hypothetical protein
MAGEQDDQAESASINIGQAMEKYALTRPIPVLRHFRGNEYEFEGLCIFKLRHAMGKACAPSKKVM